MLFVGHWNVWNASPIFSTFFLCNIQCISTWPLCGLLRCAQGFIFIPVFWFFFCILPCLHVFTWIVVFCCQSAWQILDLLLSCKACCSCFDFKRDLLGQTWPWTYLKLFLADACAEIWPPRSWWWSQNQPLPLWFPLLSWLKIWHVQCGFTNGGSCAQGNSLNCSVHDSCWRHWKTPLRSCTQYALAGLAHILAT